MSSFKDALSLMAFGLIVMLMFTTCVGCSMSRNPAKQQQKTTSVVSASPTMQKSATPVPVHQIDLDGDGTISATERQSLIGDQPSVLLTFATIVGMVIMVSVVTAWASKRWGTDHRSASQDTSDPPKEPAAPRGVGRRQETDTFL
jgi:hypothetical protein